MNLNAFVKGTCDDFCPPKEIKMRATEKLLHFFEMYPPLEYSHIVQKVPVKCFSRSAAGIQTPEAADLRTVGSLSRTVAYLLEYILMDNRKPYHYRYDFIFDRLRSVRQEIVIQNLNEVQTAQLIEPMVMFLSYSSYKLCQSSIDVFDPKICYQHLQECLKKLLCCYDEIEQQHGTHLQNREFFECLYVVFNLGNVEALNRALQLSASVQGELFHKCLSMSLHYASGNLHNSIRAVKQLPPILCGVAMLTLQKIRRELLLRFSSAYHSKMLTVPGAWLANILIYDNVQTLLSDCQYYNIEVNLNARQIKFNKLTFDQTKDVIPPRHETFADAMLTPIRISDVLLLH
ncbi:germinal-center associated nuclear protein isoform X3 [Bradysia coprophila]|uniref:germinal-center associated nuclear protein isoform X3 n=1 Tax=Bradysia coprophila TaxID=38358 RepID=UPI00187DBC28|nr:germinal-center associated nuclear protein isoform X3 [Bradysia coprophila]